MPQLVVSYQKQTTVSKLKKAYANMLEMIKLSEIENGPISEWEFPSTSNNNEELEFVNKYFTPYIRINEYGGSSAYKKTHIVNNIDGVPMGITGGLWFNLSDGTSFAFFSNTITQNYVWVFIDINSESKPNRLGKDIFMLDLYRKKKLIFWGESAKDKANDPYRNYSCKKGTGIRYAGGFCGAWIYESGWRIPENYPW